MTGKKTTRAATMELDLEAYRIKNQNLSEHLAKALQEKAQAYQQINYLNKQYWRLHRKYVSIKKIIQLHMRDSVALLTNFQDNYSNFFMLENDSTTESSARSNLSQNASTSLHNRSQSARLHNSRSQRSAGSNGNMNGISDSSDVEDNDEEDNGEEDVEEKLNTIQEEDESNYWCESVKRLKLMVTGGVSPPTAELDPDSSMACQLDDTVVDRTNTTLQMQESDSPAQRRRRIADKYNPTSNVSGSTTVDDFNAGSTVDATTDDLEHCNDLSKSSRYFMMKSLNLQDEASANIMETNASFQTSTPFGEISSRLRTRSKTSSATTASPCTILKRASSQVTTLESRDVTMQPKRIFTNNDETKNTSAITSEHNIDEQKIPDMVRSKQKINNKLKSQSSNNEVENICDSNISNRTSSNSKSSGTKVIVSGRDGKVDKNGCNDKNQSETDTTETYSDDPQSEEKENRYKKTAISCSKSPKNSCSETNEKRRGRLRKARAKSESETDSATSDEEFTLINKHKKLVMVNDRKRIQPKRNSSSEIESSCDDSTLSEIEEVNISAKNDSAVGSPTSNVDRTVTTTCKGDGTVTEIENIPNRGRGRPKRMSAITLKDAKKIVKVVLDRLEIESYTATTGQLVQQIEQLNQVAIKTKKKELVLKKGQAETPTVEIEEPKQSSSPAMKKVKRLIPLQRLIEVNKNSPRPTRAAKPNRPLCESNLKKKLRRSK
ncbi:unnamed protein product [Acanthoscelides obtectus]|uniref:Uncharacterized protein n=1 Tax=Acanthoscelides obtectus TaxID=200917 RepID=A0A9P0LRP7_ACAOB|nr:unnamed protein product [Acanthoscelides obtectus]CAK1656468.1 hypothetical protein AOBTE_LOCUS19724 [Acanthoscelides obtectus]